MKKVLAVLVLLALVAAAVVVPGKIKEAKSEHEQKMFTAVDTLGRSFRSLATGDKLKVGIYSPMADFDNDAKLWSVSGIVGVALSSGSAGGPAPVGNELFEPFTAQLRNNCKDALSSTCVRVEMLTVGGARVLDTGEGVTPVPGLSSVPMEARNRASSLIELQAATQTGGTPAAPSFGTTARAGAIAGPSLGQPPPRPANPLADTGNPSSVRNAGTAGSPPAPPGRSAAPAAAPRPTAPVEKARPETKAAAPAKDSRAPRAASGSGGTDVAARAPAAPAQTRAPEEEKVSSAVILQIKRGLKRLGYDPGPLTGRVGAEAFSAIMAYQRRYELTLDGKPSLALLKHIENNKSDSLY